MQEGDVETKHVKNHTEEHRTEHGCVIVGVANHILVLGKRAISRRVLDALKIGNHDLDKGDVERRQQHAEHRNGVVRLHLPGLGKRKDLRRHVADARGENDEDRHEDGGHVLSSEARPVEAAHGDAVQVEHEDSGNVEEPLHLLRPIDCKGGENCNGLHEEQSN